MANALIEVPPLEIPFDLDKDALFKGTMHIDNFKLSEAFSWCATSLNEQQRSLSLISERLDSIEASPQELADCLPEPEMPKSPKMRDSIKQLGKSVKDELVMMQLSALKIQVNSLHIPEMSEFRQNIREEVDAAASAIRDECAEKFKRNTRMLAMATDDLRKKVERICASIFERLDQIETQGHGNVLSARSSIDFSSPAGALIDNQDLSLTSILAGVSESSVNHEPSLGELREDADEEQVVANATGAVAELSESRRGSIQQISEGGVESQQILQLANALRNQSSHWATEFTRLRGDVDKIMSKQARSDWAGSARTAEEFDAEPRKLKSGFTQADTNCGDGEGQDPLQHLSPNVTSSGKNQVSFANSPRRDNRQRDSDARDDILRKGVFQRPGSKDSAERNAAMEEMVAAITRHENADELMKGELKSLKEKFHCRIDIIEKILNDLSFAIPAVVRKELSLLTSDVKMVPDQPTKSGPDLSSQSQVRSSRFTVHTTPIFGDMNAGEAQHQPPDEDLLKVQSQGVDLEAYSDAAKPMSDSQSAVGALASCPSAAVVNQVVPTIQPLEISVHRNSVLSAKTSSPNGSMSEAHMRLLGQFQRGSTTGSRTPENRHVAPCNNQKEFEDDFAALQSRLNAVESKQKTMERNLAKRPVPVDIETATRIGLDSVRSELERVRQLFDFVEGVLPKDAAEAMKFFNSRRPAANPTRCTSKGGLEVAAESADIARPLGPAVEMEQHRSKLEKHVLMHCDDVAKQLGNLVVAVKALQRDSTASDCRLSDIAIRVKSLEVRDKWPDDTSEEESVVGQNQGRNDSTISAASKAQVEQARSASKATAESRTGSKGKYATPESVNEAVDVLRDDVRNWLDVLHSSTVGALKVKAGQDELQQVARQVAAAVGAEGDQLALISKRPLLGKCASCEAPIGVDAVQNSKRTAAVGTMPVLWNTLGNTGAKVAIRPMDAGRSTSPTPPPNRVWLPGPSVTKDFPKGKILKGAPISDQKQSTPDQLMI